MQIERRATSLLDCDADMQPIFYKDSNFLPKPSFFPFYLIFEPKITKNRGPRGRKTKKNDKKCTFFEKKRRFFLQVSKIVVTLHSQFGNE